MTIYLDNSATTFPKPESVYSAVDHAFRNLGANPGRGGHRMSLESARLVLDARDAVAELFEIADASRVVFTSGATESINLALFGVLQPGDRVVTTSMEHNAVARPLRALADTGVIVEKVQADTTGLVTAESIRQACSKQTRLVAMTHCSNVTGTVQPIEEVAAFCQENGILLLVDAAQSAGLLPLSVRQCGIDLLAIAGHKSLYGPVGTGLLYVAPGVELKPLIYGGTGSLSQFDEQPVDLPERFESGTMNTPGIAGLLAGVEFINQTGLDAIRRKEKALIVELISGLKSIEGLTVYGPAHYEQHGGAVSFNCSDLDPAEIGFRLDHECDIMVRVGLHCAPDAHRSIGTFPRGTIRVSPGYFNTLEDMNRLIEALKNIVG
jgi:cysteine desulfurase family protein